jgi:Tol biopolymer transport system component
MVRPDGSVKVLDFGLAKGPAGPASLPDATQSPTLTSPMTMPGIILGTAAYMSPEQARGRPVDRRADAWAWGCVLYECLTGKRAFPGADISETLAAILKDTPDWSRLPADTPPRIRELLARCLAKDPRERQRDLGDVCLELAAARREGPAPRGPAAARALPGPWAAAALALAVATGLVAGWWIARVRAPAAPTRRVEIVPPDQGIGVIWEGEYALSPDGRALVAAVSDSAGSTALYVRSLESREWRRLDGTEDADFPFWSPDSRDIGFFARARLKRVPAAGGETQDLCAARDPRGGVWTSTHEIVFEPSIDGPFSRVPESGGTPVAMAHAPGYASERYPVLLPDGVHFLYLGRRTDGSGHNILIGSVRGGGDRVVTGDIESVGFSPPDRLLFRRGRSLLAQRLDMGRGVLVGAPVKVKERPSEATQIQGSPTCSVASDGTLLYATRDTRTSDVTWVDRGGHPLRTIPLGLPGVFSGALSPDSTRLAASSDTEGPGVYVIDLARGTSLAIPGTENAAGQIAWMRDGARLVTSTFAPGRRLVAAFDAAGSGRVDSLTIRADTERNTSQLVFVRDLTRDGATLVIGQPEAGTSWDVMTQRLGDGSALVPYANSPAFEGDARLSHDDRWLAYVSTTSGRPEIYVDSFPRPAGARRLSFTGVSLGSGPDRLVWWRADDREIEYLGADGRTVYAAAVRTSPTLELGEPRPLFVAPAGTTGVEAAPDGQRFLVFGQHGRFVNTLTLVLGGRAGEEK